MIVLDIAKVALGILNKMMAPSQCRNNFRTAVKNDGRRDQNA